MKILITYLLSFFNLLTCETCRIRCGTARYGSVTGCKAKEKPGQAWIYAYPGPTGRYPLPLRLCLRRLELDNFIHQRRNERPSVDIELLLVILEPEW